MTTHAEWDQNTGASTVASAFAEHIAGRTVVIAGVGPSSIGSSTALAIASARPAQLVLVSRTLSKIEAVQAEIREAHGAIATAAVVADFSSLASVRAAAAAVERAVGPGRIDVLINNAAVNVPTRQLTADGFEMQWQTNHLGPFLLTKLLLPRLRAAGPSAARVVNVTSAGHVLNPIRFSDVNFARGLDELPEAERPGRAAGRIGSSSAILPAAGETYSGFLAYAQSKTANVLMAEHMAGAMAGDGIAAFSVHPGSIWTDLSRHLDDKQVKMIAATSDFWKTLDQGAATTLVAAFDPRLADSPGAYLSDCQIAAPAAHATGRETAERLWRLSEMQTQAGQALL